MSETSSREQSASSAATGVAAEQIDASCRGPVLFLFTKAAAWLFLASAIGFIAALKFHGPQKILVDSPWLTYGRLQPAALNALVYGFAIQTGLGVALWLLARLGRTTLVQSGLVLVGGLIWNLGVAAGVFGILIGDSTGYEWLEMPRYASPILFAAYVVIGICGLLTFHRRRERSLYPSQWFLLAALFWFPWIYSVGNLLLVFFPVRGALQAVINWWYLHNLSRVWLGSVGLATIFYFLPKLLGRPLHSAYLAMFALWTLLLFGSMGGIYSGAPLPSWIPGLSTVFTVLSLVSVIAVAVNCDATLAGELGKLKETLPIRFIAVGAAAYVLAGVFGVIDSLPILSRTTHFTFLSPGLTQLFLYGFFAMTMFGAIYYIAPKLAGIDFPSSKMVRWHFSLSAIGFAISFVSLAIAGLLQGQVLNDSTRPFLESLQSGLRLFRLSTLGDLLMLFGNLAIAVNLSWLWCRRYCSGCVTSLLDAAKSEPAEVKP